MDCSQRSISTVVVCLMELRCYLSYTMQSKKLFLIEVHIQFYMHTSVINIYITLTSATILDFLTMVKCKITEIDGSSEFGKFGNNNKLKKKKSL